MSNIQKALATITEIEPSKRGNETITDQGYLKRLALGVQNLSDDDWNSLSTEAQDWFNKAADAIETKQDIPAFPDLAPPAGASTGRRRGAAAEPAAPKAITSKDVKKGDVVTGTTKRGKAFEGKVVEADDQGLVLEGDVELDHDKIDTIALAGATGAAAADPDPTPEVGDMVKVTTKRGKTVVGTLKELTAKDLVIVDKDGEPHEFDLDRLEGGITVEAKGGDKPAKAETGRTRTAAATSTTTKEETKPASGRATPAANGGVSITGRIRELIAKDLAATKDSISAVLKKEGLEFKQTTLDLTYSDMHKIVEALRSAGRLK